MQLLCYDFWSFFFFISQKALLMSLIFEMFWEIAGMSFDYGSLSITIFFICETKPLKFQDKTTLLITIVWWSWNNSFLVFQQDEWLSLTWEWINIIPSLVFFFAACLSGLLQFYLWCHPYTFWGISCHLIAPTGVNNENIRHRYHCAHHNLLIRTPPWSLLQSNKSISRN